MTGGLAVRANLLCVTFSSARGRVLLFDLDARRLMSHWTLPASPAGYSDAGGVAMDEHFHLFVADACNDRVRHYSAFGRHLGDLGVEPGGAATRDRAGVLDRPHAVALWDDTVYGAGGDHRRRRGVQRLHRDGRVQKPLLPQGDSEGWFGAPRGLWADALGLLVADTLHGLVLRYRLDGTFIAAVATAAGPEDASRPVAVARTRGGALLVVDHGDRPDVRLISVDGRERSLPPAMQEHVQHGLALARDEQDRIYVLDRGGERVQRFGPDLGFDAVLVDLSEHLDDFGPPAP
jgi:hypothetical protein